MSTWIWIGLAIIAVGLLTVVGGLWWLYRKLTHAAVAAGYALRWGR